MNPGQVRVRPTYLVCGLPMLRACGLLDFRKRGPATRPRQQFTLVLPDEGLDPACLQVRTQLPDAMPSQANLQLPRLAAPKQEADPVRTNWPMTPFASVQQPTPLSVEGSRQRPRHAEKTFAGAPTHGARCVSGEDRHAKLWEVASTTGTRDESRRRCRAPSIAATPTECAQGAGIDAVNQDR